tara:strand:- start:469 stop:1125 length:657 start_codon:yes stop_codon:yes gene_type:complete
MNLVIYCAGGLGREVYDIAIRINKIESKWDRIIFSDDTIPNDQEVYSTKNYSLSSILENFDLNKSSFVIANGDPFNKVKIFDKLKKHGLKFEKIIDPTAIISHSAKICEGAIICQFASVSCSSIIKQNAFINRAAIIGHDVMIGSSACLSPNVVIGGNSSIGCETFIGTGALIKEKLNIGNNVIVSMGAVVYKNIEDKLIVVGNPARVSRKNRKKKIF